MQDPDRAVASPDTAVSPAERSVKGVRWERRRLLIGVAASLSVHLLFVGWTAFDWGTRGAGIGASAQNDASSSGAGAVSLTRLSAKSQPSVKAAKAAEPVKVAAAPMYPTKAKTKPVTHLRPVHPASLAPATLGINRPTTPTLIASKPVALPSTPVPPTSAATTTPASAVPAVASAPTGLSSSLAPTHSRGIAVLTAPESPFALATPESPRPAAPPPTEDDTPDVRASPEPIRKVSPTARPVGSVSASSPPAGSEGNSGASSNEAVTPNAGTTNSAAPTESVAPGGVSASSSTIARGASEGGQASGGAGRGVPFASAGGGGSVGPDAVRIAYVLDVSGSMKDEGKIDAARQALLQAVAGLRPSDHFTFILFSDRVHPLTTGLISAADTVSVKQLEDRFVATVPYGETDLSDALDRAFDLPGIQRVFLLSDGGPTLGIVDYDDLADHVRERAHGGVRISTFALGAGEQFEGVRLLRRIAEENGGDYRYVNVKSTP